MPIKLRAGAHGNPVTEPMCTVIADLGAHIKLDKIELMRRLDQRSNSWT